MSGQREIERYIEILAATADRVVGDTAALIAFAASLPGAKDADFDKAFQIIAATKHLDGPVVKKPGVHTPASAHAKMTLERIRTLIAQTTPGAKEA